MQGSQQEKGPHDLVGLSMDRGLPPRSGEVIIMYMLFQMHLVVFWNNTGDFVGISDHIHMFPSKFLAKNKRSYLSIDPYILSMEICGVWTRPPPERSKALPKSFTKDQHSQPMCLGTTEVEVEVENAWLNIQSIHVWPICISMAIPEMLGIHKFMTWFNLDSLEGGTVDVFTCHLSGASPVGRIPRSLQQSIPCQWKRIR